MKQTLALFTFLLVVTAASAQKAVVRAQLVDTMHKQQLSNATVSLINATDSSLIAFTRTDDFGSFYFDQLKAGKYRLSASQVNFHPQWKNFEITKADETLDLGTIYMKDKSIMQEVVVTNQRPPVVVNGDTLEFNAEAFKTKPNAVVEEMLKKMPGVEVDKEGNIKVNGKRINRVLVNGKDFFNGDPKMATKNLPADALDKVQVFEKQSDQAAFTGIDDGNSQTTLNLKLKKDKANAAFGKIGAAAGTDGRYDGQFNINKFNGDQQLSAIGMANNTNRQGFSFMDMMNFTGQNKKMMSGGGGIVLNTTSDGNNLGLPIAGLNNSQGINQTIAGGLNYNDTWKKNTEVNASYFYSNIATDNEKNINRQNVLPGNSFTYLQNANSDNRTESNRFNFSIDHRIDSFNSIKLTSLIGFQTGKRSEENNYQSFIPNDKELNNGFSNTNSTSNGSNIENTLLYKHKFHKKGRTLSLTGSMQYNDSKGKTAQNSINNFFDNGSITKRDTLDQQTKINSLTHGYSVNANYTEPLSKRALLEFRGFYNNNNGDLDRKTYDYNAVSGQHDKMNAVLSSAFENTYNYTGGGTSYRTQQKKYGFSFGANVQYAELKSHLKDSAFSIKQNFTNVLPLANFNYSFSKFKTIRFDYNTSTSQPSASQLQPVKNISDPLNIVQGNPALKPSYTHNLSMQLFNANPSKRRNLFGFINYTVTQNSIVNSDVITNGARVSTPVNANGVYAINGNLDRGFPLKKLNTRIGIGASVSYNNSVNFINGDKNNTGNFSIAPRLTAGYSYKDLFDINVEARVGYNEAKYSLQPILNNNYWRQEYNVDATLTLPKGFTIATDLAYTAHSGRITGYNTNVALWNASISKQVFKNKKGEIKLSAFDLLKQNIGVDRNGNANYVEDVSYKVLQRYFTAGFTYSLQKAVGGGPRIVMRRF